MIASKEAASRTFIGAPGPACTARAHGLGMPPQRLRLRTVLRRRMSGTLPRAANPGQRKPRQTGGRRGPVDCDGYGPKKQPASLRGHLLCLAARPHALEQVSLGSRRGAENPRFEALASCGCASVFTAMCTDVRTPLRLTECRRLVSRPKLAWRLVARLAAGRPAFARRKPLAARPWSQNGCTAT